MKQSPKDKMIKTSPNKKVVKPTGKEAKKKEIESLEREIEVDENQIETAEKYPTETKQFYSGLQKQKEKLAEKKNKLTALLEEYDKTPDEQAEEEIRYEEIGEGNGAAPEPEKELTHKEKKEIQVIEKIIVEKVDDGNAFKKLSRQQIELIKTTVAKGATDDELKLFINVCQSAQLNPFLKQVHFVKRWDSKEGREVGAIQVGIDGFRAIAEGGGQYAGSDDAIFKDEQEISTVKEKWTKENNRSVKKEVTEKLKAPGQATVTVYKMLGGTRCPFTATARWAEYYPGPKQGYMWHKMPYNQLSKCAEALALRKAFPKLLSGLYAPEEMDQAGDSKALMPGDDLYKRAKVMIGKAKDVQGLNALKGKVEGSEKYTDTQKKELIAAIDARVGELC